MLTDKGALVRRGNGVQRKLVHAQPWEKVHVQHVHEQNVCEQKACEPKACEQKVCEQEASEQKDCDQKVGPRHTTSRVQLSPPGHRRKHQDVFDTPLRRFPRGDGLCRACDL